MQNNSISLLEELYNKIKNEVDKNATVDLLEDILTSDGIHDYFVAILKNSKLVVEQATIEAQKNVDQQIDRVTLTGITQAYNTATSCIFIFTVQFEQLTCAASFAADMPWSLDGVPWIVFEKPTYHVLAANGGFLAPTGTVSVTLQGTSLTLSLTLPDSNGRAIGTGIFEAPASISSFLTFVGGINLENMVPEPIQKLANIGVKSVLFTYNAQSKVIDSITLDIGSADSWSLRDKLKIENANVHIMIDNPGDLQNRTMSATVSGDLLIGVDEKVPRIFMGATIPELKLSGQLTSSELPLSTIIKVFWSDANPSWPEGKEPAINALSVSYNCSDGDYVLDTNLALDWSISIAGKDIFTIKYISLYLMGGKGWNVGNLSGSIIVLPNSTNLGLILTASYLGNGNGWQFQAQQNYGELSINDLFKEYIGWDTRQELSIDGLGLKIETKTNSYQFTAKTAKPWEIDFLNLSVPANVMLGYNGASQTLGIPLTRIGQAEMPLLLSDDTSTNSLLSFPTREQTSGYYGEINADITWNSIEITVFYSFDPAHRTYGVTWGSLTGEIEEKVIKDQQGESTKHQIATLKFTQTTTMGSMIETMVSWATGSKFSLSAPWDVLDKIPLSNFELVWDFTDETITIKVNIGPIDLGFVTVNSIGLSYEKDPDDSTRKAVMIDLNAKFIWGEKIPKWDITKPETTPAPAGSGNKYLDLRLLAMGQHITFDGFQKADTVQKAIDCMTDLPEPKSDEIPQIRFDANNSWLFGADFGVLRIDPPQEENNNLPVLTVAAPSESEYVLTLQTVFNDPNLYALRIALAGDAAKIFKGLDFQILYRKLSDNLGVYKTEIILPDVMRFLNFGACGITLPVFGIEIYTNGDFKVDIGFPWNEDFSRSFTVEAIVPPGIPLQGSGGLYFGKIPQITADNLPMATNGHFNPILILGFGARLGLGKSIDYGILKADLSLTIFGILEGLLAKWNPYSGESTGSSGALQLQGEYYFWMRGTFGIIGRIYGSVDFIIVKADVNILLKLYVQITYAAYQPIPITIVALIEAATSLVINLGLFKINIHFSFSVRIKETITIGALQNPNDAPWKIGSRNNQGRLLSSMSTRLRDHTLVLMVTPETKITPNWSRLTKPQTPIALTGYVSFAATVAGDLVFKPGVTPDKSKQVPCYIASLFILSVPPASVDNNTSALKAAGTEADTAFETLAKTVTRWAIASIQPNSIAIHDVDALIVSDDQLKALQDYLSDSHNHPIPITAESIEEFLANQISLTLSIPPNTQGEENAAFFPMPLALTLQCQLDNESPTLNYSFAQYNKIAPDFISWLRDYFNQLAVQVEEESGDRRLLTSMLDAVEGDISVANFVFSDYFVLIMKQMLQTLRDGLRTFKYPIVDGDSGNSIVAWVNSIGQLDKLDSCFSLHDLFEANADHKLNTNVKLVIDNVEYTVQTGDSFAAIAEKKEFNSSFDATRLATNNADKADILFNGQSIIYKENVHIITGSSTLRSVAEKIFKVNLDELLQASDVLSNSQLLLPFAILQLPSFQYTVNQGDTLNSIAASHGINVEELSLVENGKVVNIFVTTDSVYLNLVHLPQFQVGELIKEAQRNKMLEHLSSMVSRYYLHGLRLPTDKITPQKEGMWVSKDSSGQLSLPSSAGLFALTGQQIEIPMLNEKSFTITLSRSSALNWIEFSGGEKSLSHTINSSSIDYKTVKALHDYATQYPLDTGLQSIGMGSMLEADMSTYPLSSSIRCQTTTDVNFPSGGTESTANYVRLWYLTDAMCSLPQIEMNDNDPCPSFKWQVDRYDEASGESNSTDIKHYGWTTAVDFKIKRLSKREGDTAYDHTYEIVGADGRAAVLLERIVQTLKKDDGKFAQLILGYSLNLGGTEKVLRAETGSNIIMGISQANLSTVTKPPSGLRALLMAKTIEKSNLLNKPSEFIRLLWEASITRDGGFYLYYTDKVQGGLPDLIFNDQEEALVTLIVLYNNATSPLHSYMNGLLTGDPINLSTGAIVARAISSNIKHIVSKADTLASIAERYYSSLLSLTENNQNMEFISGSQYIITHGIYIVATDDATSPGGNLTKIATHFNMDPQAIKDANPRISNWSQDLSANTTLRLPQSDRIVGTDPGGSKLQEIADFYCSSATAIVGTNHLVKNLIEIGQSLTVVTGPFMECGTELPGVQTFRATRKPLPQMPDKIIDPDSAKNYLLYLYTLLGYRIDKNQDFINSNIGLPLGPKGKSTAGTDKIRYAKILGNEDCLEYSKGVPYIKLIGDGKGQPEEIINPYQGIGRLLQINYSWNDLYGNRLITDLEQDSSHNSSKAKMPILTGYTDNLVGVSQWPGISSHWVVAKSDDIASFLLNTSFLFDPSPYNKSKDIQSNNWQVRARVALITYEKLLSQLQDPNGIDIKLETNLLTESATVPSEQITALEAWLTEIRQFLEKRANGDAIASEPARKEYTLSVKSSKQNLNDQQIFALNFELIIRRTRGIAQNDFAAMPGVRQIASPITALTVTKVNGKTVNSSNTDMLGLDEFAKNFEDCLSEPGKFTLTVGTGENRLNANVANKGSTLWGVRLGENKDQGISFAINEYDKMTGKGTPQIFAPRPVLNQLANRSNVSIKSYSKPEDFDPITNSLTGLSQELNFSNIDLDSWIRQLFKSIDNLLSPEYMSSMLLIDNRTTAHPQGITSFVDSFNQQKKALAKVASNLMSPVYQDQNTFLIESAKESLYQELLVKLSNLYSIRAAVAFSAKVKSDEVLKSTKLYGNIVNATSDQNSDDNSNVVLTSTKLNMHTDDNAALTFLVESPALVKSANSGATSALSLDLCFNTASIEHQISALSGIKDYKASAWLGLVRPETVKKLQATLGKFEIPMFIRSFPATPLMNAQSGTSFNSAAKTESLTGLSLWNYSFTYARDFHYAQDRIYGEIEYNVKESSRMFLQGFEDTFQSLAQFISVKNNLEELLKTTVPIINAKTSDQETVDKAAKILGAYLKMMSDVVSQTNTGNFSFRPSLPKSVGENDLNYKFFIEENEQTFNAILDEETRTIRAWVIKIVSDNGILPIGMLDGKYPYIDIQKDGIIRHDIADKDKDIGTDFLKGIYAYWYSVKEPSGKQLPLAGEQLQVIKDRTMVIPGINILQRQNAKSNVWLKRNEELVKGYPSNNEFVYQTPKISFTNSLQLTIDYSEPFDIATITTESSLSLVEYLSALFTSLFKESTAKTQIIQMECKYEYSLSENLSPVSLPVLLLPNINTKIDFIPDKNCSITDQDSSLICKISASIMNWFSENKPIVSKGRITFDLTIMSDLTQQPMPLIRLKRLYLDIKDIRDFGENNQIA
jgi:LysM repeat protein